MKNFWKKTGLTCLTILPGIISFLAQMGIGILVLLFCYVIAMAQLGFAPDMNPIILSTTALELFYEKAGLVVFIYHIVGTIGFSVWYYLSCGKPKIPNPLKHFSVKTLIAVIILSLGLCLFANAFIMVGYFIAPAAIESFSELMQAAGIGIDSFAIFASIVLAPIGEEILCRGLTLRYAKKLVADMNNRRVAFWIANCLQAIMFGVIHGNLIQGMYAFILGLGLGWLREHYNSLYPAILAHAIINFSSTYLVSYPLSLLPETLLASLLFMVVSIGITFLGIFIAKSPSKKKS